MKKCNHKWVKRPPQTEGGAWEDCKKCGALRNACFHRWQKTLVPGLLICKKCQTVEVETKIDLTGEVTK